MDLEHDVVWRYLTLTITHHIASPERLRLYVTVRENGRQLRAEEGSYLHDQLLELVQTLEGEVDVFARASGDNGVRSLF